MHPIRSVLIGFGLVLLALSMGSGQSSPTSTPDGSAGMEGTVSISPVRAGPIRAGDPESIPLANVAFEIKQDGRLVGEFQTDLQGRFRKPLPPGRYTVARKDNRAIGTCGPFEVTVVAGKMSSVHWECDSGLR